MKKILYVTLWLLLVYARHAASQCTPVNTWRAAVLESGSWKYIIPTSAIPNWTQPTFSDVGWTSGAGGIGYGDGDDNTLITSTTTLYMRHTFNIIDTSVLLRALFCMDYDDGYVAYLNGKEIVRSNVPMSTLWNDLASSEHEAQLYQGGQPDYINLSSADIDTLLKNGSNVLCVEVHNFTTSSSDLSSRPFLMLGFAAPTSSYFALPTWFAAPDELSTKLPIISINTLGQTIIDDPRITCDMGIIYNGVGATNCVNDPFNNYNGKISIEIRGSTSSSFPKRPYGFSTIDASGNDLNVSLLNMPAEHDWTLLNPYTDKTFMRDVIIHDLARDMNWYSSRVQFVELIINGEYQGVYVLMEKIKRDDNRVNISKLDNTMNSGDALTGGYIWKIDKTTGTSGPVWYTPTYGVPVQNHVPKFSNITSAQQSYLENYIATFENALNGPNYQDPQLGYRRYANVYSFVDFFILNELSNNIDGYRLSTFMYKDRNSKCGRFTMGPYWDFNLSFGNADYCNGYPTTGWQMYVGCGDGSSKWINKMLQDPWFKNLLNCRYNELRQTLLSTTALLARVDTYANYVREASVRDSSKWTTIGNYIWPNAWIAPTWQAEIDSMKLWISNRLAWMDANMYATTQPCSSTSPLNVALDEINFHSDSTTNAGDWLELHNYGSSSVDLSHAVILDGDNYQKYCVLPQGTILAANARLVIYADSLLFTSQFPTVSNKVGPLCFKLNNAGQKLVIRDKNNRLIVRMNFSDQWQCTTDGYGRTLQLTSSTANPNLSSSWFAACMGGSPGSAYSPCNENPIYSEINYNSSSSQDAGDWIELHNKTTTSISLAGWSLRDGSNSNVYTFPTGTTLLGGKYLVVYSDAAKFNTQFPTVSNKIGPTGFGFATSSDVVRLYDNVGKLRYSVCYSSLSPWPTSPNGGGKTLENASYSGNHNAASSWFAGCPEGSPGYAYDPNCVPVNTQELLDNDEVIVYPNPAHNIVHIQHVEALQQISLFNAEGKEIQHISAPGSTINIAHLAKGFYWLQIRGKNQKLYVRKIVKD